MKRARITAIHPCDSTAQVVTTVTPAGAPFLYRREPCAECPWRKDSPRRAFPVEAYRHSAHTCYDLAGTTFACHMSGTDKPTTCAGFILSRDARHNMNLRLRMSRGDFDFENVTASGLKLYPSYRAMAVANGVPADDPVLAPCRSEG